MENCFFGGFAASFPGSCLRGHGWSHALYTPRQEPGSEKKEPGSEKNCFPAGPPEALFGPFS